MSQEKTGRIECKEKGGNKRLTCYSSGRSGHGSKVDRRDKEPPLIGWK
jgi:hypothetical protein